MAEYEELNHMTEITDRAKYPQMNYLPHHFVLRESSTTTKLRVVFDASVKTTNGNSLNDTLLVGAKLQSDIFDILLRFRIHAVVYTADIAKMFRQIWVRQQDRQYQCIVWRPNPTQPVKVYQLNTVTYGTACGPFLATRALHQLARDVETSHPRASTVIRRDFYVDDLMSGESDVAQALEVQKELVNAMETAGLTLRKWTSNSIELMETLPQNLRATQSTLQIEPDIVKTLGMQWKPDEDVFTFTVDPTTFKKNITKRTILSDISQLYDPIGWLSPVVVRAKILLQQLWVSGVKWDDRPPEELSKEWTRIIQELPGVNNIRIPRGIYQWKNQNQLHGFCDASENAYAAVVYVTSTDNQGNIECNLLCAKTRVAPIKRVTLPRLELCAAVLLTRLILKVQQVLHVQIPIAQLWTDSTIVLAWIRQSPHRWKTFVANRVAEIQEITAPSQWRHVPSALNPADIASRGVYASNLAENKLWWQGPNFLRTPEENWPNFKESTETQLESKTIKSFTSAAISEEAFLPFQRVSSFKKLQRIMAVCVRFISKTRHRICTKGAFTVEELQHATIQLVKLAQRQSLHDVYDKLSRNNKQVYPYTSLNLFIDNEGCIRVGGRLKHANIPYGQKHPLLLPRKHPLTALIIQDYHKRLLHPGTQLLLASLRQEFWVTNGRSTVKFHTRNCIRCFRDRAQGMNQMMGDLPSIRVSRLRVFQKTGVDFGGPFQVKQNKGRGGRITKAYLALFVCMSVKAIHVELVSDLSAEAFIAALKRFIARRGVCSDIFSDNGTNFVGANTELKRLYDLFKQKQEHSKISAFFTDHSIRWHFIPPRAPHFGGLWEAGIKSVKQHLRRVLGNATLTFEELYTTLVQIEACVNSRPITPLSTDPMDLEALTPGHFLVGSPLMALPEPDLLVYNEGRLRHWQLLQRFVQHFWRRWSVEYLTTLQQRYIWNNKRLEIKINDLVLIKEENLPPMRWQLARVVNTHPGDDGLVRVVTLKTKGGLTKRTVSKICKLPSSDQKD